MCIRDRSLPKETELDSSLPGNIGRLTVSNALPSLSVPAEAVRFDNPPALYS